VSVAVRFLSIAWLVCGNLIAGAAVAQGHSSARPGPADASATVAWLKRNANPLSNAAPPASELKRLVDRLGGTRVIGLGETTSGAHEEMAFKAALIRALVTAGRINAIAFVANFHTGKRLDAYVAGGAGTADEVLRASGMPPHLVTREVADLLAWVRQWNASRKARIYVVGVDVQDALRDTQAALSLLAAVEPEAAGPLQEIWKDVLTEDALRRPFGEVVRQWSRTQWETLFVAAQVLDDLLARPTPRLMQMPGFVDARHAARAARLGLAAYEFDVGGNPVTDLPADAFARRDLAVGEHLMAIVGAPARAVLWAHDAQLARGAYRASGASNTGDLLSDKLGPMYRTVGFAWRQGTFHAAGGGARATSVALARDSLGGLLARTGKPRAWFDLTAVPSTNWSKRWRAQPYERGWLGSDAPGDRAAPTPLGNGIDYLVFFEAITPSQPLNALR
jgi:erythromycin esterase